MTTALVEAGLAVTAGLAAIARGGWLPAVGVAAPRRLPDRPSWEDEVTEHNNPGPPERCYDDCPMNHTGNTEDCTCAGTMMYSAAALFARQRDDAQAIVLSVSRILGISHLADGLEHGRVTDAVRSWMDTAVRLTRERDTAGAEVGRLRQELADVQESRLAWAIEADRLDAELAAIRAKLAEVHDAAQYDDITTLRAVEMLAEQRDSFMAGWGRCHERHMRVEGKTSCPAIPADGGYNLTALIVTKLQRAGVELSLEQRNFLPQIITDWVRAQAAPVSGSDTTESGGDQ